MAKFVYTTRGTCSRRIVFDLDGDMISDVQFEGGCNGNLRGISMLVRGMRVSDVLSRLEGIRCGLKPTSCPDQFAQALRLATTGRLMPQQ